MPAPLSSVSRLLVPAVVATLLLLGLPVTAAAAPVPVGNAPRTPATTATAETARTAARKKRVSKVRRALRIAKAQRGDLYQYGASGPHRFDCSGLVFYSTHRAGFRHVPRTSSQQSRFMRRVTRRAMRPGDFVFFTGGGGVYHVGVYVGRKHGRRHIVHAPGSGQRVRTERIWTDAWFAGTLRRR
jgi:cell wall-associated NlpC family hydrolase